MKDNSITKSEPLEEFSALREKVQELEQARSDLREAEAAFEESEERYHVALEASNDGVAIVQNGVHVYVNQAFLQMFQYKSLNEIVGNHRYFTVHPDDYERVLNYAEARRAGSRAPTRYEFKGIRKDGVLIDIEASVNTISYKGAKAILAYLRDVTERKQAEEEIARERHKLKTLSDNAPFGMILIDEENHFTYINKKFTELFGYNLSDIPDGRTWCRKAYPDAEYRHAVISGWKEDLGDARPGEKQKNIFAVTCKDGTWKVVEFIFSVLISGGSLMTCKDITELRQLENQLRQSQKMKAIGTLAGGIAHDFNNILAGIMGFTEMVMDDLDPASPEHHRLGLVLKGAHRGRDLVKQILTFSRQAEHEQKPVALSAIVEEGLKLLRPLLPATTQIRSKVLTGDDTILADPAQIHQVLMNLCTNGVQAMGRKGGVLEISVTRDHFKKDGRMPVPDMKPGDYVTLTVHDTGCGMKPEILERAFDPFFTTKAHGEGTGLGLSMVHGIVKSHGGFLTVESKPGKGSLFSIYLPRTERQEVMADEELRISGGKECILFIDDEDLLVELNNELLGQLGYDVVATTSSLEALKIFKGEPGRFHLVITDYTMPEMTGVDLAKRLLQIRDDIPIILCTGYNDDISPDKAKRAGIREFLLKPQSKRELGRAIRRTLDAKPE
ncbi:MAG: hypothetical protein H6Q52_2529 [Deltaproteobacteria bacterium]|nr:hypothetical protein [Deltaproteobacteria bacterium]